MPEPEDDLAHALGIIALMNYVEADLARMKAGLEPNITYIWTPHEPPVGDDPPDPEDPHE